jgi:hypothetical protein
MIRRVLILFCRIVIFLFLTILTQIGGLVYLASFIADTYIDKCFKSRLGRWTLKFTAFLFIYLICTFFVVPPLANFFGRVPLPITGDLKPLNKLTWFLNRQYVQPKAKELLIKSTLEMKAQFPEVSVNYLDANFPFLNKFPLPPHLSHNDGKKVDVAFFYDDKEGKYVDDAPSPIGYGVYEAPRNIEVNLPDVCAKKGYWQYSLIGKFVSQQSKADYVFDATKVSAFISILCKSPLTQKIFIEPHLKDRMRLQYSKIRFHGCQAVRHDDHIHLQIN